MNGMNDFEKELAQDIREIRQLMRDHQEKLATVDKKLAVHKAKSGALGALGGTAGGAGIIGLQAIIDYIHAKLGGA